MSVQTPSRRISEDLVREKRAAMRSYRCYLLDCRNEIATIEMIHCAYDMEARQRADDLLVQRPEFHGVEVWQLERRVYVNIVGIEAAE
jgi:hypothetical protein